MSDLTDFPFLGRGWRFPVRFSHAGKTVGMAEGVDDIEESLRILMFTTPGERVMLPTYGCDLQRFLFEDLTSGLIADIRDTVATAILRWEPRIDVLAIDVAADADQRALIRIAIDYQVRRTNVRRNMVFPYSLTEATLAQDSW